MAIIKKPTINQLLRKIEKLEAENKSLEEEREKFFQMYKDDFHHRFDLQYRIDAAIEIMQGIPL